MIVYEHIDVIVKSHMYSTKIMSRTGQNRTGQDGKHRCQARTFYPPDMGKY